MKRNAPLATITRYLIRDWSAIFENSQSRQYQRLSWVPIPNKHDGKSFRRLIAHADGPALYGAWLLIVQVASKCPVRGVLADGDGPLDADDLAAKTGCPATVFAKAFEVLTHPKIAWLEIEQLPADQQHANSGPTPALGNLPLNRTELNYSESEKTNTSAAVAADDVRPAKASKTKDAGKSQEPIAIPSELDTPDARQALCDWREHRRQKRKPLTAIQETKLLAEWASKGSERFVAAVNHSIANGWQGLFEPNAANNGQRPAVGSSQNDPRGNFAALAEYRRMKEAAGIGGQEHDSQVD